MPARIRLNAAARDVLFRALGHPSGRAFLPPAARVLDTLRRAGCIAYRGFEYRETETTAEAIPVYSLTTRGRRRAESIGCGRLLRALRACARRHGIVAPFPSCEYVERRSGPHVRPWHAWVKSGTGQILHGTLDIYGTLTFRGPLDMGRVFIGVRHGDMPRWDGDRPRVPPGACDHMTDLDGNMRITPAAPAAQGEKPRVRGRDGTDDVDDAGRYTMTVTWRDGEVIAITSAVPTPAAIRGAFLVLASIGLGVAAVLSGAYGTDSPGESA